MWLRLILYFVITMIALSKHWNWFHCSVLCREQPRNISFTDIVMTQLCTEAHWAILFFFFNSLFLIRCPPNKAFSIFVSIFLWIQDYNSQKQNIIFVKGENKNYYKTIESFTEDEEKNVAKKYYLRISMFST